MISKDLIIEYDGRKIELKKLKSFHENIVKYFYNYLQNFKQDSYKTLSGDEKQVYQVLLDSVIKIEALGVFDSKTGVYKVYPKVYFQDKKEKTTENFPASNLKIVLFDDRNNKYEAFADESINTSEFFVLYSAKFRFTQETKIMKVYLVSAIYDIIIIEEDVSQNNLVFPPNVDITITFKIYVE